MHSSLPIRIVMAIHLFMSIHCPLHVSSGASNGEESGVDAGNCVISSTAEDGGSCSIQNHHDSSNMELGNDALEGTTQDELASDTGQDSCKDDNPRCGYWASLTPSECEENPVYMLVNCKKACRVCGESSSTDPAIETSLEIEAGSDLGEPQDLGGGREFDISRQDIKHRIIEARVYMETKARSYLDPAIIDMCRNKHELCAMWSLLGECEENPGYMKMNCAPVCQSCDYLTIEARCPLDANGPDVWSKGDLDSMFRRLSTEEIYLSQYDVKVLSSPESHNGGPWVLTMENVVTEEEAERLIELGAVEGYVRSTDVGATLPDGTTENVVSNGRTSTNAWCMNAECYEDRHVKAIVERITNMTKIPEINSEHLQLLKYETGQYYQVHHDYIELEVERQQGVRILTVYLYLNDVEAGGGTNFPKLNLTVMPKRGRALIWPSVTNRYPTRPDRRTDHQALPVERGIKYGANFWYHLRDFKTPNANNCQ